ncbi:MAG: AarF/ABC1/UbiB kinase family protein [Labilithrix sp.]|nr:AarF/ABC1/UbiB kinase family protein [Labilithrix sp.]MCW5816283.1 AarF/ABC1/UbiB kinase family protein [Labilithrix sp.]
MTATRERGPIAIDALASGFRKRTLVTASLAGKVGVAMAKRTLRGRAAEDAPSNGDALRAAKELALSLGAMKGLVMKIGQMASYLPGALPDEAQRVLSQLQADTVAMSWDRIAETIREELGAAPESLFDDFDPKPFAAASIGQVHRARFQGRAVAVKVQYPGIEDVLRSDLSTIGAFARMSTLGLPLDGGALADELRSRIVEECDYALEAKNQRALAALFARDADVRVPAVVAERSSRRVLTTELVVAQRFGDFVASAPQAAKDRAGEILFRTSWDGLFRHGVFNGDPHPGNYLFDPDGAVTLLDFGCVRRFDRAFIETWKDFARGALAGDRAGFDERFRRLGMVGRERSFDYEAQWNITQYLYQPFLQRSPFFTYGDEYVKKSYGVIIFDNPNQRRSAMPPEWLLLNRLQWGMNAVLAKLGATAPWPDHFSAAAHAPFEGLEG